MKIFARLHCSRGRLRASLAALAGAALLLSLSARAQTMDDGNRAFAAGQFPQSTAAFQAVLAQDGYSAPVLFNLGNSRARQGQLPEAILAYKRARWLAPGDEDTAANLKLAEQQAGLPPAGSSVPERIAGALSANSWAWTGSAALTLLCISLFVAAKWPRYRSSSRLVAAACAICLLTAVGAIALRSATLHEAVVMDRNASALISPFPGAQAAFAPTPGETLLVQKSYGDFFLVRDQAGHAGWIAQSQIALVVPAPKAAGPI